MSHHIKIQKHILDHHLVELLIDEAAKIIAGDIESWGQFERGTKAVEGNN